MQLELTQVVILNQFGGSSFQICRVHNLQQIYRLTLEMVGFGFVFPRKKVVIITFVFAIMLKKFRNLAFIFFINLVVKIILF